MKMDLKGGKLEQLHKTLFKIADQSNNFIK
jgi:hypothetical protein